MMKDGKLTKREEKFCQLVVQGYKFVDAFANAGYKVTDRNRARQDAYKLKRKPYIAARIEELTKMDVDETVMKKNEVLKALTIMAKGLAEEENIVADKNGNYKIVKTKAKCKEQAKALELLGKFYTLFTDKQEVTGNINTNVTFVDDLEDDNKGSDI